MPLTDAEEAILQKYIEELQIPPEQQDRIRAIAEMPRYSNSLDDAKSEVENALGCFDGIE